MAWRSARQPRVRPGRRRRLFPHFAVLPAGQAVRVDAGGCSAARRLHTLVVWGEGPHLHLACAFPACHRAAARGARQTQALVLRAGGARRSPPCPSATGWARWRSHLPRGLSAARASGHIAGAMPGCCTAALWRLRLRPRDALDVARHHRGDPRQCAARRQQFRVRHTRSASTSLRSRSLFLLLALGSWRGSTCRPPPRFAMLVSLCHRRHAPWAVTGSGSRWCRSPNATTWKWTCSSGWRWSFAGSGRWLVARFRARTGSCGLVRRGCAWPVSCIAVPASAANRALALGAAHRHPHHHRVQDRQVAGRPHARLSASSRPAPSASGSTPSATLRKSPAGSTTASAIRFVPHVIFQVYAGDKQQNGGSAARLRLSMP